MTKYIKIHNDKYLNTLPPNYFPFKYSLDNFQLYGCQAISNNENLLVTAHTGSGKTVLALYGIAKTLSEGKKVIYTSPIKALSNQKYAEFAEHFNSIGIMTGDIKINPIADLLIMTTEILRNSLLRKYNDKVYEWNFNPQDIGCVILDEVHYINNNERGKIWEEIIINLEPNIQLIMLSATITGAEELATWIGNLKKIPCNLVTTLKRPVPLQHGIWHNNKISYFLYGDTNWITNIWENIYLDYKNKSFGLNNFFDCIKYLYNNDLTPVNIFILNRKLIEIYAKKIPIHFTTTEESANIQNIWNSKLHRYKKLYETTSEWNDLYTLVSKGIGIHHSGMIPILKEIIEILYSTGLIKILLATETFALGVNMPTKTVVFFDLYKFDGNETQRLLKPEEYAQMAGRAGRRGKDSIGNVIILPHNNFINENYAKNIILTKSQKIQSKLSIDSIFILKKLSYLVDSDIELNYNNILIHITDNLNKSLFNYQDVSSIKSLLIEYDNIKDTIKSTNIDNNIINIYNELILINNKLDIAKTIKINYKCYKELLLKKNNLTDKIKHLNLSDINDIIIKKNKLIEIEKILDNNSYNNQIILILKLLITYECIDTDYKLTKLGKIISEINECNPFLLGNILFHNNINKLEFAEIVALCSIFINEHKSKDSVYITDLNCSNTCKEILYYLENYIKKYKTDESNLNNTLPYPYWLNWDIDLGMFNSILLWANNFSWYDIVKYNNIFQGNFIKTILRIINILKNINNIAIIFNNIYLINILTDYETKLIRDIVISDSLYI